MMSLYWDLSSISIQYFTGEKSYILGTRYKVLNASKNESFEKGAIMFKT